MEVYSKIIVYTLNLPPVNIWSLVLLFSLPVEKKEISRNKN